jgi:thioredoxin reductase
MNSFNTLIIGGSAAGLSCALILGSAIIKPFAKDKKVGIFTHQKASALQNAELNNVLGFKKGTKGADILAEGVAQLTALYPHIVQIPHELVIEIQQNENNITVISNKNTYTAKNIVVATTPSNLFNIKGLIQFVQAHTSMPAEKEKIMLKNTNHKVTEGIYVAGVIAGWRSQFAIAAGSGAAVATDILTEWNNGNHAMVHDVIEN